MPFRIFGSILWAGVLTGAIVMAALPSAPTRTAANWAWSRARSGRADPTCRAEQPGGGNWAQIGRCYHLGQ